MSVDSTDTRLRRPTEITAEALADLLPEYRRPVPQTLADLEPEMVRPTYRGRHRTTEDLATRSIRPELLPPDPRPFLIGPLAAEPPTMDQPEPVALLGRILHALGLRGPR